MQQNSIFGINNIFITPIDEQSNNQQLNKNNSTNFNINNIFATNIGKQNNNMLPQWENLLYSYFNNFDINMLSQPNDGYLSEKGLVYNKAESLLNDCLKTFCITLKKEMYCFNKVNEYQDIFDILLENKFFEKTKNLVAYIYSILSLSQNNYICKNFENIMKNSIYNLILMSCIFLKYCYEHTRKISRKNLHFKYAFKKEKCKFLYELMICFWNIQCFEDKKAFIDPSVCNIFDNSLKLKTLKEQLELFDCCKNAYRSIIYDVINGLQELVNKYVFDQKVHLIVYYLKNNESNFNIKIKWTH